jgi:hypothetical protein
MRWWWLAAGFCSSPAISVESISPAVSLFPSHGGGSQRLFVRTHVYLPTQRCFDAGLSWIWISACHHQSVSWSTQTWLISKTTISVSEFRKPFISCGCAQGNIRVYYIFIIWTASLALCPLSNWRSKQWRMWSSSLFFWLIKRTQFALTATKQLMSEDFLNSYFPDTYSHIYYIMHLVSLFYIRHCYGPV